MWHSPLPAQLPPSPPPSTESQWPWMTLQCTMCAAVACRRCLLLCYFIYPFTKCTCTWMHKLNTLLAFFVEQAWRPKQGLFISADTTLMTSSSKSHQKSPHKQIIPTLTTQPFLILSTDQPHHVLYSHN